MDTLSSRLRRLQCPFGVLLSPVPCGGGILRIMLACRHVIALTNKCFGGPPSSLVRNDSE
jgi:hypothetical protein